ncbi:MAG: VTT domain-containing protein [Pseudomonadota bacterium]
MTARIALLWVALTLLSHAWGLLRPPAPPHSAEDPVPQQCAQAPSTAARQTSPITMRSYGPATDAPRLLLLLPNFSANKALISGLSREHHLRVPDLMHADVDALAGCLRGRGSMDPSHVIGVGQAAPLAAALAAHHPDLVRSVQWVSPRGIAELEGVGEYHLNEAARIAQHWILTALRLGTPHFGALDGLSRYDVPSSLRTAATPRALPDNLRAIAMPAQVLVGALDDARSHARADEYSRLVAHSERIILDAASVASSPGKTPGLIAALREFVDASATAPDATRATPDRQQAATAPFDWANVPPVNGQQLLALLLLLMLATYVTEDLTCITAGLLVARGVLGFWPATLACLLGIFTGDLALYFLGRALGRPALRRRPLRWLLTPAQLARSEAWFDRRGAAVIILSRFVPGSRVPCYVAAGVLGMPFWRFTAFFALAAALWTPLLVALAWLVGERAVRWLEMWGVWGIPLTLGAVLLLYLTIRTITGLSTHRGRRLLYAAWQRRLRWEFWPPWLFYPPIVLYILVLGIRHRGLTVFTAANPAMPAGGFVGESKVAILGGLGLDHPHALPAALLPQGEPTARVAFVEQFVEQHGLGYPLVLKPDAGERGREVAIVRDAPAVLAYLAEHPQPTLVQAFAPGHEYGVFYYRHPDEAEGRILAITDKRPVHVTGDGHRPLESLILDHPRAVFMAPHFLKVHAARLDEVPAAGEEIPLVEVGTHCLGCLFLDGKAMQTPALAQAIDQLSRRYDGFYFGRYDIRTPSSEDFAEGHNFKVIELNGVTSEATSIYDPGNSLLEAYRVLMHQWRLAFEIGAANRARGIRPSSIGELLAMLRAARAAARVPPASSDAEDRRDPLHQPPGA